MMVEVSCTLALSPGTTSKLCLLTLTKYPVCAKSASYMSYVRLHGSWLLLTMALQSII